MCSNQDSACERMTCVPELSKCEALNADLFLLSPEYYSSVTAMEEQSELLFNGLDFIGNDKIKLSEPSENVASTAALLTRQSSLTEVTAEWFGQHVSDINVGDQVDDCSEDISYEALMKNVQPHDFGLTALPNDFGIESSQQCLLVDQVIRTEPSSQIGSSHHSSLHLEGFDQGRSDSKAIAVPAHKVGSKVSGCKRRASDSHDSQDDSDADSQSSDDDNESEECLQQFARDFLTSGMKNKPYFWQYNVQSRGPKGKRLCSTIEIEDSHLVPDFSDPVFESHFQVASWKHGGRARQGDGNDPRPDPNKLLLIGLHIWKLEAKFRSASQEVSADGSRRSSANRRKNQLASRICRLKKKALHSANKIKLDGLKQEHNQLMRVIKSITMAMEQHLTTQLSGCTALCQRLNQLVQANLTFMIAGNTAEYVNSELEKVARQLLDGVPLTTV